MSSRFIITFTAAPGVDGSGALRWMLKRARRQYGLVAIDVREETSAPANVADALVQLHHDVASRWRTSHE